jgi:spermidine/putrescine transport system substrate-binding protein
VSHDDKSDWRIGLRATNRRRFLQDGAAFAGTVIGASALAGCGSSSSSSGTTTTSTAAEIPKPTIHPKVDGDINFYTFAQYIPPSVVTNFEKKYGVKVNQSFYSTQPEMVTKMATGAPIDVVLGDSAPMPQLLAGKLIQPYDPADLKNFDQLDGYFKAPWWDHGKYRYSVPYGAGPTGIMWRKDKVSNMTNTWNDIWSHPQANGHIYLLSQVGDTMGMALVKNGFYCNSGVQSEVQKATTSLLDLKPHVASFTTNLAPVIQSGDAWLMEGWTTQIYQGLVNSPDPSVVGFSVPPNGPLLACDTLSVGVNAKAPGTALLFMDWIMQYDNNYALGKYTLQRTGGKGGDQAYADAVGKYPQFLYPNSIFNDFKNWKVSPVGQRLQLWNQSWSQVIA